MEKDYRYKKIKREAQFERLTSFDIIFDIIPRTLVGKDLGMHNQTFSKMLKRPELFTLEDVFRMATLFEIEAGFLFDLIHRQYQLRHVAPE